MKVIDRNYRILGIINPVDLLVIVSIAAVAVAVFAFLTGGFANRSDGQETIEVTLAVREVRNIDIAIAEGDEAIKVGVGTIGTVTGVSAHATQREVPTLEGELKVVESALTSDATITVQGKGSFTEGGVLVGDALLVVNQVIDVRTPRFMARMTIVALERTE